MKRFVALFLVVISVMSLAPAEAGAKPPDLRSYAYAEWIAMSAEEQRGFVYGFLLGNYSTVEDMIQYNPGDEEMLRTYQFWQITGNDLIDMINYVYRHPSYRTMPLYVILSQFDRVKIMIEEGERYGLPTPEYNGKEEDYYYQDYEEEKGTVEADPIFF